MRRQGPASKRGPRVPAAAGIRQPPREDDRRLRMASEAWRRMARAKRSFRVATTGDAKEQENQSRSNNRYSGRLGEAQVATDEANDHRGAGLALVSHLFSVFKSSTAGAGVKAGLRRAGLNHMGRTRLQLQTTRLILTLYHLAKGGPRGRKEVRPRSLI